MDVPPIPNTLVVNTGDYVSLLTEGKFVSPLHRVVHPQGSNRLSFVFFYYPAYDSKLDIIPSNGNIQDIKMKYSLLQNQNSSKSMGSNSQDIGVDPGTSMRKSSEEGDISEMSFGEFISNKWSSVQR